MKSLKADLPALAELIRSQGRGRDTVLAHITPQEAALLKKRGGSGAMNPATGLPEFQEDYGVSYNYDVEAQPGGFYGGEAPTGEQFYQTYQPTDLYQPEISAQPTGFTDFTPAPGMAEDTFEVSAPTGVFGGDVEAQQGGFYGGRAPSVPEFARTRGLGGAEMRELTQAQPTPPPTPTAGERPWYEKLGLSTKDLTRLGLGATIAGGLTAANVGQTRRAAQQAEAARGEFQTIARPYQETGRRLQEQAQRGELTESSRQSLAAAQARLAQGVATRGGVGVEQAQAQIANLRNLMLENQFNFGIKVSQIGDQYAMGGIRTGLQADRAIASANQQFYGQLATLLAPFLTGQQA